MEMNNFDFGGWATKIDIKCSDGRTIRHNAFKDDDHKIVPLVWNHQHNSISNILGKALLEHRDEGVFAYCSFNDSESGQLGKLAVEHGDVTSLSIFANQLVQNGLDVVHGVIREVSLVLAGANPGATIMEISHSDDNNSAIIYTACDEKLVLAHSEDSESDEETRDNENESSSKDKTVSEVIDTMTDSQKAIMYDAMHSAITGNPTDADKEEIKKVLSSFNDDQLKVMHSVIGEALASKDEGAEPEDKTKNNEEESTMKHNVFDKENSMTGEDKTTSISQSDLQAVVDDAKRIGSMRQSALQHGITDIEYLFPDDRNVTNTPTFISRPMSWVNDVMGSVHHTPFSRVKSMFADITADEARAKGYVKGKYKVEEVFSLLKRTTSPTTVYKKQRMDRDDIVDITDFSIVPWIKTEMRMMLNEELARAYLIGDGRQSYDNDKINPLCIRPIWTDEDLFTIKAKFTVAQQATADDRAKAFIRAAIKSRKNYRGSGSPVLFTTEDILTDCLLLTDANGRDLYETEDKLAKKLRVSKIVTVPVMEGQSRTDGGKTYELFGIIVNLNDYNVGADKGGAINMFEDFDIDYNAEKYLMETRCSAALTVPYSAIAVELESNAD